MQFLANLFLHLDVTAKAAAGDPPSNKLSLTAETVRHVMPSVEAHLDSWRSRAEKIPSLDLRAQAVASIGTKAFHCAGGGMYGLLAGERREEAIRFIVAYQTISDYLDNLCDRSISLDPNDFRLLHSSMLHALTPRTGPGHYYRLREEQDDGGYLAGLVATCQDVLSGLADYEVIAPHLHELAGFYIDLQVYKHISPEERLPAMQAWFEEHQDTLPAMAWHEFAACAGSTLGIFAVVAYACRGSCDSTLAEAVKRAHFPWVQGIHILLDYLIDQDEDRAGGDLNLCSFYSDQVEIVARFLYFHQQANASVASLPYAAFHRAMNHGLLGLYGSDPKAHQQVDVGKTIRQLVLRGGSSAWFFYGGCRLYRRLAPRGLLGGASFPRGHATRGG